MRIIIAPAKKMIVDTDTFVSLRSPVYLKEATDLMFVMKSYSFDELKDMWKCSDKIAKANYINLQNMNLEANLTPAIMAYDGIAFKYMAPSVFEDNHFSYISNHLRILSGFYGVLNPLDGVVPYRLEMQADIKCNGFDNLYDFWGDKIYKEVSSGNDDGFIVNLASKEYSTCIEKYLTNNTKYITCVFGEYSNNKIIQKGVYAKMARGEMVRFMAENNISDIEQLKSFDRLGYSFDISNSTSNKYVFLQDK